MRKLLFLVLLGLLVAGTGAAQDKFHTSLVNPGHGDSALKCDAAAETIKGAIRAQHRDMQFDLLVICEASFWLKVVKSANLPEDTLAFATIYKEEPSRLSRLVIDARASEKPWLSVAVKHELHHIACRCQDGD